MTDPTVFIVDDDEAVRDSLGILLETSGLTVETYPSGIAFLKGCGRERRGCALLDVQLPDLDGLAIQERLRAAMIDVKVIMITARGDVRTAVRAMQAGAVDFVEKPLNDCDILDRIGRALRQNAAGRASALPNGQAAHPCVARLTCREREVLEQLVLGRSNKSIAFKLGISPRTVEIHRARVMEKMEARSIAELVRVALSAGIAP